MKINIFENAPVLHNGVKDKLQEYTFCIDAVSAYKNLFLEFGVHRGTSITQMATRYPHLSFFGFDTFEGLNEVWHVSDTVKYHMAERFTINKPKVPDNVALIEGLFQDTLPGFISEYQHRDISFINIDCDLYSSTFFVLETLNSHIKPGVIIRFDELCDWRIPPFGNGKNVKYTNWQQGEWKALVEWCQKYDREINPLFRTNNMSAAIQIIK